MLGPLLKMSESDVETFHTPLKGSTAKKRPISNSPQSLSQPAVTKKRRGRTLSVGESLQHVSVMSVESIQIHKKMDKMSVENSQINKKLDKILNGLADVQKKVDKIDVLEKSVSELQEKILTIAPPVNSEEALESIKSDIKDIKSSLDKMPTSEIVLSTQEAISRIRESQNGPVETPMDVSSTIRKIPLTAVIPNVDEEFLKPRSRDYYKHLHNGDRLDIHKHWLSSDPPFVPPNYLPKKLPYTESFQEYRIRKHQKLNELDAYMELLQVKTNMGKDACQKIDLEVKKRINESELSPEEKTLVLEEYDAKIRQDEDSSKKKWQSGRKGIEDLFERSKDKIVIDGDRTYKVVVKNKNPIKINEKDVIVDVKKEDKPTSKVMQNNGQTPGKRRKVKDKLKTNANGFKSGNMNMPSVPFNFSVPPPQYPFPWVYPPIVQR